MTGAGLAAAAAEAPPPPAPEELFVNVVIFERREVKEEEEGMGGGGAVLTLLLAHAFVAPDVVLLALSALEQAKCADKLKITLSSGKPLHGDDQFYLHAKQGLYHRVITQLSAKRL